MGLHFENWIAFKNWIAFENWITFDCCTIYIASCWVGKNVVARKFQLAIIVFMDRHLASKTHRFSFGANRSTASWATRKSLPSKTKNT